MDYYHTATQHFQTLLDFLRFGISSAYAEPTLYYGHGTDNAVDDLHALVLGTLSLPPDCDPSLFHGRLTEDEKQLLCQQIKRRIHDRVPVPYLTNTAYFCGLSFYVDERVLIPRSPLAELIQRQFSPWVEADKVHQVLDLCTGSGCIAVACCYAFPDAEVDAVDISAEALQVAATNRERHDLVSQLTLIQSDCFDAVPVKQYDIIVSNPPYVGAEEMLTLPSEYQHEPNIALETAQNGLAVVEKIFKQALPYLAKDGILVVEVGNSEEVLIAAYPQVPFTWLDFERGGGGVFLVTQAQLQTYF